MSRRYGTIYWRPELPSEDEGASEVLDEMKSFAEEHNVSILKIYVDKCPADDPSEFDRMMSTVYQTKSRVIIVKSLHHLTKDSLFDLLQKLGGLLKQKQTVLSIEDGVEINEDIYEMLVKSNTLLSSLGSKIKSEKINFGIYRKRKVSADGKVHGVGKRGNYRKKDKDEVVMRMRNQGYTLQQIADQEGMSVGRVRNIIKCVQEENIENMPTASFKSYTGLEKDELKQT